MTDGLFVHCPFCDAEFTVYGDRDTIARWTWVTCPRCDGTIRLNVEAEEAEA